MKNTIKYSLSGLLILSLFGLFTGCDEDENLGTADRLFRPVIKETSFSGTWIRLEWDKYEDVQSFNLQLSVDSFETVIQDVETDTTFYVFEDLDYDTNYQLRIRSMGVTVNSEYFVNENIKTSDYPTRLLTPGAEDVIDNRARIKWNEAVYDSLLVSRNDTLVASIVLTEENNAAGEVIISQLTAETSFVVRAYTGGEYMGKKSFTTLAPQVFEGVVVDLRELSEEESYEVLTQAYMNELSAQYPEGFTMVLSGGTTYGLNSGIQLSTSVRFVTGLSLKGFAIMAVANNFDLVADAQVAALKFEKIIFTDHPDKPRNADSNFGGTYVFNFRNGGAVLGELSFENCDIRYKRGVVRMQGGISLEKFLMNNCFVDSIGGYGVLNFDHDASIGGDIIVTNSTISHSQKFIVARKAPSINAVILENVTACFMPNGSGDYILDLENKAVPGGVLIKNSIFGPSWGSETSRGIRSGGAVVTVDKSYRTSDQKWSADVETSAPLFPIELEDFGKPSTAVFANPSANDYSVSDAALVGRIGDSRWW